jgi:peptidoglycan hydrolase CwlO-like protein
MDLGSIVIAGLSAGIGAAVSWGMMKQKVSTIGEQLKELKDKVVYKDTCDQCKINQNNQTTELKEDIKGIREDIKALSKTIMERLPPK